MCRGRWTNAGDPGHGTGRLQTERVSAKRGEYEQILPANSSAIWGKAEVGSQLLEVVVGEPPPSVLERANAESR
jgi:hypothetical protein